MGWISVDNLAVLQRSLVEQWGVTYQSCDPVDRCCRHVDRPHRNHTASTRSLRPAPNTSDLSTWWWERHSGFNTLCDPAFESWSLLFVESWALCFWALLPHFQSLRNQFSCLLCYTCTISHVTLFHLDFSTRFRDQLPSRNRSFSSTSRHKHGKEKFENSTETAKRYQFRQRSTASHYH